MKDLSHDGKRCVELYKDGVPEMWTRQRKRSLDSEIRVETNLQ